MRISRQSVPVLATLVVCLGLYLAAAMTLPKFGSLRVFVNFFGDSAYLGIVAVGMTFVILTGGIDLSVGALVGCTSMVAAVLIEHQHWHPALAIAVLLFGGTLLGATHGFLIQKFELPPFLVTLAGLFLCRGIGLWVSSESVGVEHPFFDALRAIKVPVGAKAVVPFQALLFLTVLVIAAAVARFTRFGRTVYAVGGSEQSAVLMGLPVHRTKIAVYALSGFCATLGGLTYLFYLSAGDALAGQGLELDVIAAVVIGGTLLSGGYGSLFGTLLGILIVAIIERAIAFQGTLTSWWIKICTGALLLAFILLQRFLQRKASAD